MEQARRGRLSKVDLLPEEAWPFIKQAYQALYERKREAEDIRQELNNHLLAIGCEPISRSGFNRKSLALAKIGSEIAQAREMAKIFAEKLNDMPEGDVGMLINEMCKAIIYNITQDAATLDIDVSAKMMKEISLAVYRLEQAGAISTKRRAAIVDRAKQEAGEAVKEVAKAKGLSDAVAQELLSKVLGKPEDAPPATGQDKSGS